MITAASGCHSMSAGLPNILSEQLYFQIYLVIYVWLSEDQKAMLAKAIETQKHVQTENGMKS